MIKTPVTGKILEVDLSTGAVTTSSSQGYSDGVIGGPGIAIKAMLDRIPTGTRPLDPENIIVFSAGVLVGTTAPAACRTHVASMNAFNGGYGAASAAGFFAPELKYAGYDNIIVTGAAKELVYLYICDDKVEIRKADFLCGLNTWETEDAVHQAHDDETLQVLSIGPAGENLVLSANIMVSRFRSASRCGLGAIMGSKGLKAIAVRGTGSVHVAQPKEFFHACGRANDKIRSNTTVKMLRKFGTPASFPQWNKIGNLPGKNYQTTTLTDEGARNFTPARLHKEAIQRNFGCFSCPIHCTQYNKLTSGKYKGLAGEKLECQAFWDFGAKLEIDSVATVIKGSNLCGQLGLDMNNATGSISWAMECFQRGLLTLEDTGGLDLSWGNDDAVIELLHQIANQTSGLGRLLKDGTLEAARKLGKGSEAYVLHIKGQDLAEEFRALVGWALGIMVSERGGGHTNGAPLAERYSITAERSMELFGVETASKGLEYEGKAEIVVYYQKFHAALEALGICFFGSNWLGAELLGPEDFVVLYNLANGTDIDVAAFFEAGERTHNLHKLFNLKHTDFKREDDVPQDRMFEVPETSRQFEIGLERKKWETMLDQYYEVHGWDKRTGRPTAQSLSKLGLSEYASLLKSEVAA